MQTDSLTLYKLIILYLLDKVDFPLTNNQMTSFILEKGYTDYFNVQKAVSELMDAALIKDEVIHKTSYYRITKEGRETLAYFENTVSDAIKEDIINYLKEHKYELREEVSTLSDCYEARKGEYIAHLYVRERDSNLVEIHLNVPTLEEAENLCRHWKEKSQEIYEFLMQRLM